MIRQIRLIGFLLLMLVLQAVKAGLFAQPQEAVPVTDLKYINTGFENASPLYWKITPEGEIDIFLVYDLERESPNRANGHWFFQVQAKKGSDLTLIMNNFENVWNGKKGVPVSDKTMCYISPDNKQWSVVNTDVLDGNRLQLKLHMSHESLYVAHVQPYRISDLDALLAEIEDHPLVKITGIGKTVEGRQLEIVRIGHANTPYRILIRARAHSWEPGGNWVVQGLIRNLLRDEETNQRYLDRYALYIMPMANKDGVAHGRTRFNIQGKDLNRNWDKPADPYYAPENYALEQWINSMQNAGKRLHFAIDLHNDQGGRIHVSRPNIDLNAYLEFIQRYEALMREHTWFTEGSTGGDFRNPGTIGEGLLERFGIFACVQELNCNWIAGLQKHPFGSDWELLGSQMRDVFYHLFEKEKQ